MQPTTTGGPTEQTGFVLPHHVTTAQAALATAKRFKGTIMLDARVFVEDNAYVAVARKEIVGILAGANPGAKIAMSIYVAPSGARYLYLGGS